MDRSRIWIIGAIVAMIAVVIFGVLLGVQPQLAAASDANQQQQSIAAQNGAKQAALEQLKTDYKNLPALKATLAELQKSIPPHADLPAFISDLNALAGATSTTVTGVTVSDAQPYVPPVTAPAAVPGASATPSPSASPTASAAPKPATPQAPAPVTNAKITGGNFVAVPIKITVSGPYEQALAFMDGLQHGQRLFLVTNFASNGASAAATAAAATAAADAAKSTSKAASGSSDAATAAATPAPSSWTVSGYAYVLLNSAPATK